MVGWPLTVFFCPLSNIGGEEEEEEEELGPYLQWHPPPRGLPCIANPEGSSRYLHLADEGREAVEATNPGANPALLPCPPCLAGWPARASRGAA